MALSMSLYIDRWLPEDCYTESLIAEKWIVQIKRERNIVNLIEGNSKNN